MDNLNYTTNLEERKKGKHLSLADRGEIKALSRQGLTLRAIAKELNCSPSTVMYELKRGTPERKSHKGRPPQYSPELGQKAYEENRKRCHRKPKIPFCKDFIEWVNICMREKRWSLDACCGYALSNALFSAERMVCTKTLYNAVGKGIVPFSYFDLPCALKRKRRRATHGKAKNERIYGTSINERSEAANSREEFGHWEIDTVIGRRNGRESVLLTLLERVSREYIAIKIPMKDSSSVNIALMDLTVMYGDKFNCVFKSITADNGSEFSGLTNLEKLGTRIYFAHPYSSWERGANERHNGMLREFVRKGTSIDSYSADDIVSYADMLNERPRKILGYRTPDEVFENYLDKIYALAT